mmetsp:Transcript_77188/g.174613  ORF Transcript_77188/g.174613 Transcript_77188/m.174613 type:complete len:120 (-) Transcript_77188:103-462(-)|eukprot:CAMPEP_0197919938 /NCGR_PEP_ID=MMETSP1439-20131203/88081_1 /TAXON_ID=66791 /ORGANISM="Gonyaulax spinifera, Strain CCMP409" /LENGTH=119 /DNA_ID=CAMNT_0043542117 /DNA_START=68 /DNA_END=427 /DNA_ORIENTATION=+
MAAACRCSSRRGRTGPMLLVAALASLALFWPSASFAAPRGAGRAAETKAAQGAASAGHTNVADLVDTLSKQSLEACAVAYEDDPESVEQCSQLTYELADAEQLLFKRQDSLRYFDNDSY